MKIVAVCKTFRGHEFAISSLESIYEFVDRIVYIHSNVGWDGRVGNTISPLIEQWKSENDCAGKIDNVYCDTSDQQEQYSVATKHLSNIDHDVVQLIDTDEVYSKASMAGAIEFIKNNDYGCYRVGCYSYIKSPFFRTIPAPTIHPPCFIRSNKGLGYYRGLGIEPSITMPDSIVFHHFCSVRDSFYDVWGKHNASCGVEHEPIVRCSEWVKKWNTLPKGENLLPLQNHSKQWRRVQVVGMNDLPEACWNNPYVVSWHNYKNLV